MQQTVPPSQSVGIVQLGVIDGGISHWSGPKSSGWTQLKYGAIFWAQQTVRRVADSRRSAHHGPVASPIFLTIQRRKVALVGVGAAAATGQRARKGDRQEQTPPTSSATF